MRFIDINNSLQIHDPNLNWDFFRDDFKLDKNFIHLSLAIQAPHSISLNEEIDKFRSMIDTNPDLMRRERHKYTNYTFEAAARYLGTDKNFIALTDSSTMGLALVFHGFCFREHDEILTTNSEHYSVEKLCEAVAKKNKLKINKIDLKAELLNINANKIVNKIIKNVTDKTVIVAISWVNSRFGVKMPLKEISKEISLINENRSEDKKILLCVDGVHGFGIEYLESVHDLGIDFFAAGCHKWLFGPRGTGILWASELGWSKIEPLIPSFEKIAWDNYLRWDGNCPQERELIKAKMCTPGGFKTFEYIWALRHAFEQQEKIGKKQIQKKVHSLSLLCKELLRKIPGVHLYTPMDSSLSSGFICFNVNGVAPCDLVKKMAEYNIIIGQSPYKESCVRFTPSIYNTTQEIIIACDILKEIVRENYKNAG